MFEEPQALYTSEGEFNEVSNVSIPEGIHEHIDNPFLETLIENGILGFVYETSYAYIIVWTCDEAQEMCFEPFSEFAI